MRELVPLDLKRNCCLWPVTTCCRTVAHEPDPQIDIGLCKQMRDSRATLAFMQSVPGRLPEFLSNGVVGLLRPEDRVFEGDARWAGERKCWPVGSVCRSFGPRAAWSLGSRSTPTSIRGAGSRSMVDEFLADRRTGPKAVSVSTLRANAGTIRSFCYYVTDERYGWAAFCSKVFDDVPAQVVFEWNTPRHKTDDAIPADRRSFTQTELQTFFDTCDDLVDQEFAKGLEALAPTDARLHRVQGVLRLRFCAVGNFPCSTTTTSAQIRT